MNLCASLVSGRPYPTALRKHFADPRGRALSCFAVAERQGLIAVCTEDYGPESQTMLEGAYCRRPGVLSKDERSVAPGTFTDNCDPSSAARGGVTSSPIPGSPGMGDRTGRKGNPSRAFSRVVEFSIPFSHGALASAELGPFCSAGLHDSVCPSCGTSSQSVDLSQPAGVSFLRSDRNALLPVSQLKHANTSTADLHVTEPRQRSAVCRRRNPKSQRQKSFSRADVCGRCVILLDSHSLLPLRELSIGDLPDTSAEPPLCVCCCGHCAVGDCQLCSSTIDGNVGELSEEELSYGCERTVPAERGGASLTKDRKRGTHRARVVMQETSQLNGHLAGSDERRSAHEHQCLRMASDRSLAHDAAKTELLCVLEAGTCDHAVEGERKVFSRTGRRQLPLLHGNRSATDFFKCQSLFFACDDRLLCLVSAVTGVKILQLAELPDVVGAFPASHSSPGPSEAAVDSFSSFSFRRPSPPVDSSLLSSSVDGCSADFEKNKQQYGVDSVPREPVGPPSYTIYSIEDRFPRLLTHLQFLPNLLTPACPLEVFQLLNAGFVANDKQYESLLGRLWTQDQWRGPSCPRLTRSPGFPTVSVCGSRQTIRASRGETPRADVCPRSLISPVFVGPFVFVDCLVRFESNLPVRLLVDTTHGNKVIHAMSLLPENLVLSCCTRLFNPTCGGAESTFSRVLHEDRLCSKVAMVARCQSRPSIPFAPASVPLDPPGHTPSPTLEGRSPAKNFEAAALTKEFASAKPSKRIVSKHVRARSEVRSYVRFEGSFGAHTKDCQAADRQHTEEKCAFSEGEASPASPPGRLEASEELQRDGSEQGKRTEVRTESPSCTSTDAPGGCDLKATSPSCARTYPRRGGCGGGVGVAPEDLDAGNWRVRDAVTFPLVAFRAKEDFSFHFTSGFYVSCPTPVPWKCSSMNTPSALDAPSSVTRCTDIPAPALAVHPSPSRLSLPWWKASLPSVWGVQGGETEELRGVRKETDYSLARRLFPKKSLNQLETDFPVNPFYQLLLNSNSGKSHRDESSIPFSPVPVVSRLGLSEASVSDVLKPPYSHRPVCFQAKEGVKRSTSAVSIPKNETGAHSLQEGGSSQPGRRTAEGLSEEMDCIARRATGEGEDEWVVAVALPNALIVVVDLHHRVLARHKFGSSKSTPFDFLSVQREGRFLLAWKERQCCVLELLPDRPPSASPNTDVSSRRCDGPAVSFTLSSGVNAARLRNEERSLLRASVQEESFKDSESRRTAGKGYHTDGEEGGEVPCGVAAPGEQLFQGRRAKLENTRAVVDRSIKKDRDTCRVASSARTCTAFCLPSPLLSVVPGQSAPLPRITPAPSPLRLRLHLELPVGARFGHSGSKVERFVTAGFSLDPHLQWLVVVSRRGVNEHVLYLVDLKDQEQRGGHSAREIFLDTAMIPVPKQISWLPLTSSDILLLPRHGRFLGLLTDVSAPHHEEAFVAPYVHFRRFTSNCDHSGHAWDFDRGSTGGSSEGSREDEPSDSDVWSPDSAPLASSRQQSSQALNRRGERAGNELAPFAGGLTELMFQRSGSRPPSGRPRETVAGELRRLLTSRRMQLKSAGLDSRLHDYLEAKSFFQPFGMLQRLQRSPPSCWFFFKDSKRWSANEADRKRHSGAEGLLARHASGSDRLLQVTGTSFRSFRDRIVGDKSLSASSLDYIAQLYASHLRGLGPPHCPVSAPRCTAKDRGAAAHSAVQVAGISSFRQALLGENNDLCQPVYRLAGHFGPASWDIAPAFASLVRDPVKVPVMGATASTIQERHRIVNAGPDTKLLRRNSSLGTGGAVGAWHATAVTSRRGDCSAWTREDVSSAERGLMNNDQGKLETVSPVTACSSSIVRSPSRSTPHLRVTGSEALPFSPPSSMPAIPCPGALAGGGPAGTHKTVKGKFDQARVFSCRNPRVAARLIHALAPQGQGAAPFHFVDKIEKSKGVWAVDRNFTSRDEVVFSPQERGVAGVAATGFQVWYRPPANACSVVSWRLRDGIAGGSGRDHSVRGGYEQRLAAASGRSEKKCETDRELFLPDTCSPVVPIIPPLRHRRRELPSDTPCRGAPGPSHSTNDIPESKGRSHQSTKNDDGMQTQEDVVSEFLGDKEPALVSGKKYRNIWSIKFFPSTCT
ncbi:hypothetical protein CSUI_005586 [Cystoisospora suis]|uniref:Uncharacterized protein n=1 Tax=Cystoisospora suis TaxID=483139 RepID=A0A2C6KWJ9_9APIC|nr:hypothetical protein CSUI_005586 [Cystoisospora suis]